jgi:hypothetical protein
LVKLKKEAEKKWLKLEIDPKRIEKAFEALKQVWLPENYLKLVRWAGIDDISTLAHYRSWLIDWKIRQHIEAVAEKRGLTPTEAHTIFWYTKWVLTIKIDWIRTENVNAFLRWKLPKDLPESQTKAIKEIIENFDKWLDKMPDIEWNMVIRWDSWDWWRVPKWSEVDLYWYTSCARKKENTFIWEKYPKNDLFIEVEIIKWRAKDISELAYYTHFLGETTEEALILRNSKVVIKDIQEWYDKFTKKTWEVVDITKIKVEQIK